MTDEKIIAEINSAYRRLSAAVEDLERADRELVEHVRRVRLDNAEAILEARNERTANLYVDGLLDSEEHRALEAARSSAEVGLRQARLEVDRLQLIVRLLGAGSDEGTQG